MLEAAQGNAPKVAKLVKRAFRKLKEAGVNISREQWLKEAEQCESSGSLMCSEAIISESLNHGLDDYLEQYQSEQEKQEKKIEIWIENSRTYQQHGAAKCARILLNAALEAYPDKKELWNQLIQLEEATGTPESQAEVLKNAVERISPNTEHVLSYSEHLRRKLRDPAAALTLLEAQFQLRKNTDPGYEDILLALQHM